MRSLRVKVLGSSCPSSAGTRSVFAGLSSHARCCCVVFRCSALLRYGVCGGQSMLLAMSRCITLHGSGPAFICLYAGACIRAANDLPCCGICKETLTPNRVLSPGINQAIWKCLCRISSQVLQHWLTCSPVATCSTALKLSTSCPCLQGNLISYFENSFIRTASRHEDVPELTDLQKRALKAVEDLADSVELRMDHVLQPGDIQLLHNHSIVHARTAFVDHDDVSTLISTACLSHTDVYC